MTEYSQEFVAKRIQHTFVAPDANDADIKRVCEECLANGFDGAMIQPCWIPLAKSILVSSTVKICTAFAYPMGGQLTSTKVFEVEDCFKLGADEIDFLPNIGFLKSGKLDEFRDEIKAIVDAAENKVIKAMLEFGMLTADEKRIAAELAIEAGVHYVKNSSGWGKGGAATVEDIKLLKSIAGDRALVKASGGIRNWEDATGLLDAGAVMLGTSAGVAIVTGSPTGNESDY
jgi:deoxyribose-phosphate aldolase